MGIGHREEANEFLHIFFLHEKNVICQLFSKVVFLLLDIFAGSSFTCVTFRQHCGFKYVFLNDQKTEDTVFCLLPREPEISNKETTDFPGFLGFHLINDTLHETALNQLTP